MSLRVDCAPGLAGDAEPMRLWFGLRAVEVRAVVDRWWGPQHRWWKVETAEGVYVLRREEHSGGWELAAVVGPEPLS